MESVQIIRKLPQLSTGLCPQSYEKSGASSVFAVTIVDFVQDFSTIAAHCTP
jgi:hypothetical protein